VPKSSGLPRENRGSKDKGSRERKNCKVEIPCKSVEVTGKGRTGRKRRIESTRERRLFSLLKGDHGGTIGSLQNVRKDCGVRQSPL